MLAGTRTPTTVYVYDDQEHPDRVTRTIPSPPFTDEDRALLLAYQRHQAEQCRCGHPRSVAWHSDMDGYYDGERYVCHACTAANGGEQVTYSIAHNTRPATARPMPPFALGETTTSAD